MVTFFLTACQSNPSVTFTLVTNLNFSHPSWAVNLYGMAVPPNVVLVKSSYEEVLRRMDDDKLELGFKPIVKSAYKLSDFAPAWGKLYEEQLEGYTHW